jgi:outer membrane protein assembly factor BamB
LDSDDLTVRNRAGGVLRAVSGRDLGFVAYAAPEVRARAAMAWRWWIDREGSATRLSLPAPGETPLGKVLVCNYSEDHVFELDSGGRKVWSLSYPGAWSCQGLPDGHRLLGGPGRVDEYDETGKPVWGLDDLPPVMVTAVRRLPGGNTLVAYGIQHGSKLLEFQQDKSVCWEASVHDEANDVQRLGDGHTLVALNDCGRVVELDRQAEVVWQVRDMAGPLSVQHLDDGRRLISQRDNSRVVELDRGGKVVWSYPVRSPFHAQRLADGHTVISNVVKVIEIDAAGQVLWEHAEYGVTHLSAY